jgi:carboxyl-terminal processing protease
VKRIHLIGLSLIFLLFCQSVFSQTIKQGYKFATFLNYLESNYVDTVNTGAIVDKAIVDVLNSLDPHSSYIPADELKRMREPLEGNFEGIGVQFNILNDTIFVISPISGGPSERLGILAGDKIITVDGKNVAGIGITNEQVFSLLRGSKGTKVTVSILRRHVKKPLEFTIVRDKIPIFSIDASYMINSNTGYIKINRFAATTVDEFKAAVKTLKASNAENLVLDLTNNGGGYLDAAVNLADEFLPAYSTIVYTQGIHSPRKNYYATDYGNFEKGKIIVLIDEGSASASEILTGAIQDWDRGIVIGRRSFGKGLVQREMMLPDESAVRITTAKYYTPSGRCIQKPFTDGVDKYNHEILDRYAKGELTSVDSISFPDSLKFSTLVKKRVVYGGGGIMPDIFVPFDTNFYTDYYRDIVRKGLLNQFVLEYIDVNRSRIQKTYSTFNAYNATFKVDDKLMEQFIAFCEKGGVVRNEKQLAISRKQIDIMLKALIARDVYGNSEFYQIFNTSNETYLKALDVISKWDSYYSDLFTK